MTDFYNLQAYDDGNDVLRVVAQLADGTEVTAYGWVSATTNHYDAPRTPKSAPRTMTPDEVVAYVNGLLADTLPQDVVGKPIALPASAVVPVPEPAPEPAAEPQA